MKLMTKENKGLSTTNQHEQQKLLEYRFVAFGVPNMMVRG